jgi:RimJ/RimL family protein N-acetyltransferase
VLEPTYPLRTQRLDLRPYESGDLDHLRDMYTREDVVRYLYWGPMDEDQLRESLAKKVRRRVLGDEGDGLNVLGVERESGEVVGEALLFWASRAHRTAEVGFVVKPGFQGRGYATEMGAEMLRLGFDECDLHRVTGQCDARNAASAAVLERLGMRREAHLVENEFVKDEWCSGLNYALLSREWAATRAAAGSVRS